MSLTTATALHYALLAAGAVTWLFALYFHRRAFRRPDPSRPGLLREGEVKVPAALADVRRKAVESLRTGAFGGAGTVLITGVADRRLTGEVRLFAGKGQAGGRVSFSVDLREVGAATFAAYRLEGSPRSLLQVFSALFVYLLGPGAMVAAHLLVSRLVLASGDPGTYEAAIQTVQICHFLWPPFLFAYLRRHLAAVTETSLANLLRNTAF